MNSSCEKLATEFESETKEIADSLGVPEYVARKLNRTINGIVHLSGEVARMMGAVDDADAERIAKEATTNADGSPKWTTTNCTNDGCWNDAFWQSMLSSVYLALKRAASDAREGAFLTTLSSVVDMSAILLMTIENLSKEARSAAGTNAANASHTKHKANEHNARLWYAERKASMSKDAAAEKMAKYRIIPASFRTIRGYLTGQ